ncbi:MAG: hypothetical protein H0X62_01730 [Bacteroidetes bacterium]|nr:hypothetical protein [Bacteroidota bacterium]
MPTQIDIKKTGAEMLEAMKTILGKHFSEVKKMAIGELEDFAKRTIELAEKVNNGEITQAQAKAILKIRQNAVETVMLSIAGIGLLAAQEAINAAIGILISVLKKAIPGVNLF